jgi:xylulokinase
VTARIGPEPTRSARYRDLHAIYRRLYGDLRERFADLGRVE